MKARRPGAGEVTALLVANDNDAMYGFELLHPCKNYPAGDVAVGSEPMRGRGSVGGDGCPEVVVLVDQDAPRSVPPAPPQGGERGGALEMGASQAPETSPSSVTLAVQMLEASVGGTDPPVLNPPQGPTPPRTFAPPPPKAPVDRGSAAGSTEASPTLTSGGGPAGVGANPTRQSPTEQVLRPPSITRSPSRLFLPGTTPGIGVGPQLRPLCEQPAVREILAGFLHTEDLHHIEGKSVPPAAPFIALGSLWASMRHEAHGFISRLNGQLLEPANEGLLHAFAPFLSRTTVLLRLRLSLEREVERARVTLFRAPRQEDFEYPSCGSGGPSTGGSGKRPRR